MHINSILYISDVHLELDSLLQSYDEIVSSKKADMVVLAGDIHIGSGALEFIKHLIELGYIVVYILGNHEYYGNEIYEIDEYWHNVDIPNFYFLQDDAVEFDNVRIIGSTLWTSAGTTTTHPILGYVEGNDLDPFIVGSLRRKMSDFKVIKSFNVENMVDIYTKSKEYIFGKVNEKFDGKTVVVTHHAPSVESSLDVYKDTQLNHAFYTPLDCLIENNDIDVWIHGHMHNTSNYYIGACNVVCNPRGYVDVDGINSDFDNFKTIEV